MTFGGAGNAGRSRRPAAVRHAVTDVKAIAVVVAVLAPIPLEAGRLPRDELREDPRPSAHLNRTPTVAPKSDEDLEGRAFMEARGLKVLVVNVDCLYGSRRRHRETRRARSRRSQVFSGDS